MSLEGSSYVQRMWSKKIARARTFSRFFNRAGLGARQVCRAFVAHGLILGIRVSVRMILRTRLLNRCDALVVLRWWWRWWWGTCQGREFVNVREYESDSFETGPTDLYVSCTHCTKGAPTELVSSAVLNTMVKGRQRNRARCMVGHMIRYTEGRWCVFTTTSQLRNGDGHSYTLSSPTTLCSCPLLSQRTLVDTCAALRTQDTLSC
jgi:hypothetical protein